jgi:hypothetical protein
VAPLVLLPVVLLLVALLPVVLVPVVLLLVALFDAVLVMLGVAATAKALADPAVDCAPLTEPPEVLTQTSLRVSGLCQKLGSTSITT